MHFVRAAVLLRDDPPDPEADGETPPPERQKRVYTNYQPEVLRWLAELHGMIDAFSDRVLLGEVDTSGGRIADFYGDSERPIVDLPLNYLLLDAHWEAPRFASSIEDSLFWLHSSSA